MISRVMVGVGRRARRAAVVVAPVLAAACASGGGSAGSANVPTANRGFDGGTQVLGGFTGVVSSVQDSVVPRPRTLVWDALPVVFETLGVDVTTVNRVTFTMGNEGSRISRIEGDTRLSQFLDCGMGVLGPNADNYEVTLQLLVQLAPDRSGGTLVRTTLDAYARPRSSSGDPLHCASRRTLERRVLALISEAASPSLTESAYPGSPGGAGADLAPMSAGLLPTSGDHLRLQCRSPVMEGVVVGEGRLLGSTNGSVQLMLDSRGTIVAVPAAQVVSVEVRQRRSYAGIGGLIGAVLGGAAGGWIGASYEEENPERPKFHFDENVFIVVGSVLGAAGGFGVGRILGSFFVSDAWHSAPPEWAIRSSGAVGAPVPASPCPSF